MKHRILTILAAILVLVVYFLFTWYLMWKPPLPTYNHTDWPGKAKQVQRMRYHGTDYCVWEKGVCFFYRDGQRCRL